MNRKRMNWIKSLKVGDIVCDCRYKHLKIKEITNEYRLAIPVSVYIVFSYFPRWVERILCMMVEGIFHKLNLTEIRDRQIIMEDGHGCSADGCCDSPDHIWKHDEDDKNEKYQR